MTLNPHSGRWWPTVFRPSGEFFTAKRDILPYQYVAFYQSSSILCGTPSHQRYNFYVEVPKGLPDNFTRAEVLTYNLSATQSAAYQQHDCNNCCFSSLAHVFLFQKNWLLLRQSQCASPT